MRLILFFIVLLLRPNDAYNIINHAKGSGGFGLKDARTDANTIVLTMHGNVAALDRDVFFAGLTRAITQDNCSLSFSGDCDLLLILTLYCEHLKNTPLMSLGERAPLPSLEFTMRYVTPQGFTFDNLEYLKSVNKPAYWYGTAGNMDSILHRYYENLNQKKQQREEKPHDNVTIHGQFVEYPAPWGLDRIDMRYGLLNNEYNYNSVAGNIDVYFIV